MPPLSSHFTSLAVGMLSRTYTANITMIEMVNSGPIKLCTLFKNHRNGPYRDPLTTGNKKYRPHRITTPVMANTINVMATYQCA